MEASPKGFLRSLVKVALLAGLWVALAEPLSAQDPQTQANIRHTIRGIMQEQAAAWNRGDLEAFMQPYWHSDSLRFLTKGGLSLGYDSLYARYKRLYQKDGQMGMLSFDLLRIDVLDKKTVLVIGRWSVSNVAKPSSGHFSLLFTRQKDLKWVILLDHTS